MDRIIDIPPFGFPEFLSLPKSVRDTFQRIDGIYRFCENNEALTSSLHTYYYVANGDMPPSMSGIRHRLADVYRAHNPVFEYDHSRTKWEIDALNTIKHKYGCSESNLECLDLSRYSPPLPPLRKGYKFSKPDNAGFHAAYPPRVDWKTYRSRLEAYSICHEDAGIFNALSLMCAILTAHPFEDGNGRFGRIVFNYMAQRKTKSGFYMPLYNIALASSGSWLVCLRKVQLENDWAPIASFILATAVLYLNAV